MLARQVCQDGGVLCELDHESRDLLYLLIRTVKPTVVLVPHRSR
jgi:hypothetical protein